MTPKKKKKPILKFKSHAFVPWILSVRSAFSDADRIDAAYRVIDMTKHIGVSVHLSAYWLRYLTAARITGCLRLLIARQNFYEIRVTGSRTSVVIFSAKPSCGDDSEIRCEYVELTQEINVCQFFRNRTDWCNEESRESLREEFHLTLWPWNWTFKYLHIIYVKCEYFTNQKSNVMKYTTFCRGINWDCVAGLKKFNEI